MCGREKLSVGTGPEAEPSRTVESAHPVTGARRFYAVAFICMSCRVVFRIMIVKEGTVSVPATDGTH